MDALPRDVLGIIYADYLSLRSDEISSGFRSAFQTIIQCMIDGIAPIEKYHIYENVAHSIRVMKCVFSNKDSTDCSDFITRYTRCVFLIGTVRYVIRIETTIQKQTKCGHGKPDVLYACSVYADKPEGSEKYVDIIRDVLSDVLPITHGTMGVCWSGNSSKSVAI